MLEILTLRFARPEAFVALPVLAAVLLFLVLKTFVKGMLPEEKRKQRKRKLWMFVSRLAILALVVAALAQPYTEVTRQVQGDPRITILSDGSDSMQFLDTTFLGGLTEQLRSRIPVTTRTVGAGLSSDLGTGLLQNLEPGGNVLLVSDGHPNAGATLQDVAFYATTLNATLSVINLSALAPEHAVVVTGPGKVVSGTDATFAVTVTSTAPGPVPLRVTLDGSAVLDEEVLPGTYEFTRSFASGTHRIEAGLGVKDVLGENDRFYKAVAVLPKPRILLVSQKTSPVELLLDELYDVEKQRSLPQDLSPYYAVVVNDAPVERLAAAPALHEYLLDEEGEYYGNGLVVLGGLDSFDRGGYRGQSIEQFLPVKVGKGQRKKGTANLVFIIDVSGGVGGKKYLVEDGRLIEYEEDVPTLDVIKAQTVRAIEQLQIDNKVGVIMFGVKQEESYSSPEEAIRESVKVLEPLDYLFNNRKAILDKVPRVNGGGTTAPEIALRSAVQMLAHQSGDRNVILLSDGKYSAGHGALSPEKKQLLALAANAHALYGINFMTVGVGTSDEKLFPTKVDELFLKDFAAAGEGTYDRATRLNSLLIKWGDPKAKEFGEEFILVPLSLTHFITRGLEPTAVLNAYNEVAPKDTAEMVVAADSGQPALTVWRYGNGRVAAWTVFGGNNLGQLLNAENSELVSRTVNWAIGDPQRKEPYFVDIPDARTNEQGSVRVRSEQAVTSDFLEFTKQGDVYTARFTPSEAGFGSLLGRDYAVNRPDEYDRVGMNEELASLAAATGGKVFKPSDADQIIEFVKEVSRRTTREKEALLWPFVTAALVLFLVEILVRRVTERRR